MMDLHYNIFFYNRKLSSNLTRANFLSSIDKRYEFYHSCSLSTVKLNTSKPGLYDACIYIYIFQLLRSNQFYFFIYSLSYPLQGEKIHGTETIKMMKNGHVVYDIIYTIV
jgi:hypothetical protein